MSGPFVKTFFTYSSKKNYPGKNPRLGNTPESPKPFICLSILSTMMKRKASKAAAAAASPTSMDDVAGVDDSDDHGGREEGDQDSDGVNGDEDEEGIEGPLPSSSSSSSSSALRNTNSSKSAPKKNGNGKGVAKKNGTRRKRQEMITLDEAEEAAADIDNRKIHAESRTGRPGP